MATYNTAQKKELIDFLSKHPERSLTIDEISHMIRADSTNPPGKSTIYRLMPRLEDEGIVKRFSDKAGTKATYQIMDGNSCHCHMHMKCVKCGKLFHMNELESDRLLNSIKSFSDFDVDPGATLLFGRCSDCRGKGNDDK